MSVDGRKDLNKADSTEQDISRFPKRKKDAEKCTRGGGRLTLPTSQHLLQTLRIFLSLQLVHAIEDSRLRQLVAFCFLSLLVKGEFK